MRLEASSFETRHHAGSGDQCKQIAVNTNGFMRSIALVIALAPYFVFLFLPLVWSVNQTADLVPLQSITSTSAHSGYWRHSREYLLRSAPARQDSFGSICSDRIIVFESRGVRKGEHRTQKLLNRKVRLHGFQRAPCPTLLQEDSVCKLDATTQRECTELQRQTVANFHS